MLSGLPEFSILQVETRSVKQTAVSREFIVVAHAIKFSVSTIREES